MAVIVVADRADPFFTSRRAINDWTWLLLSDV